MHPADTDPEDALYMASSPSEPITYDVSPGGHNANYGRIRSTAVS